MVSELEQCIGFIFARGGSKGVHRKNIRQLGGKPLIAYSIEVALACQAIRRVIVSTDSSEIAACAETFGAEVPFLRPSDLAQDDTPELLAWKHALRWVQDESGALEVFVSLPPTAPFRSVADVEACIEALQNDPRANLVVAVSEARHSPYFNMVLRDEHGYARRVLEPSEKITRRQDAPEVFDLTTVAYVARSEFVLRAENLFEGVVKTVVVPAERAIDIDTNLDFRIAEYLARDRSSDGGAE